MENVENRSENPVSTGEWRLYEKHFQSLISKVKKVYFYLQVLNKFYLTF